MPTPTFPCAVTPTFNKWTPTDSGFTDVCGDVISFNTFDNSKLTFDSIDVTWDSQ